MKIKEIYDYLDFMAPFDSAAEWDNTGLSVGSLDREVKKVYIAIDVTERVIEEALRFGADLVITHHPLIFRPISQIPEHSVIYSAVRSGMTFISSHTPLDLSLGGVNTCLARKTGIKNVRKSEKDVFLNIGDIEPCTAKEFAIRVKEALGGKVTITCADKKISKIGFCGGSGGDLISLAREEGLDALLTGEAKHHELLASTDYGISMLVAGHYETENIVCEYIHQLLDRQFSEALEIKVYDEKVIDYI